MSTDPGRSQHPPSTFGRVTGAVMFFGIAAVCFWYSIIDGLTFGWVVGPLMVGVGMLYVRLAVRMRRETAAKQAALRDRQRGRRSPGPGSGGRFSAPAQHQYCGAPERRSAAPGSPAPVTGSAPAPGTASRSVPTAGASFALAPAWAPTRAAVPVTVGCTAGRLREMAEGQRAMGLRSTNWGPMSPLR
ncbi:hypothetical protein CLV63_111150 [Murinocardiopsis flavida]|uniref:Uncharacterized protein n=1 Tax=Murinocardiopsis flavida TaxID=645275 RepID=A0A2P8DH68_9ACTN|nr:hypothetical protein CLV63_111150 [Murinocardiopsis flavida]